MVRFTQLISHALQMAAAAAMLACGRSQEEASDEAAPFDAVAQDTSGGTVYGLRVGSSSVRRLCSACSACAWSPDRTRVLVESGGELQVLTAGAPMSRLALDPSESALGGTLLAWQLQSAWSTDSAWLAYVWNGAQAFIADADGQNPIQLDIAEPERSMPVLTPWDPSTIVAWSPTSEHVALRFPSGRVYVGAPQASAVAAIEGNWDDLAWSLDGALLALTGAQGADLVDTSGSVVRELATGVTTRSPSWSSDAGLLSYLVVDDPSTPEQCMVVPPDGSEALSAGPALQAAWAPSNALLALGRPASKADVRPGQLSVWSADSMVDVPTDSYSIDRGVRTIAWSSSGEQIFFSVLGGSGTPYWSVIAAADGTELEGSTGSVIPSWNPSGSELATLRSTSTGDWTLELRQHGERVNSLAEGLQGLDSWSWCAEPGQLAFANVRGVFTSDLQGRRTRASTIDASRLRFLRTTPGRSACPRVSGNCDTF